MDNQNIAIPPNERSNENEQHITLLRSEDAQLYHDVPLEDIGLSTRSYNALKRQGYNYASQLLSLTEAELFQYKNIGVATVEEILQKASTITITDISASKQEELEQAIVEPPIIVFRNHDDLLYADIPIEELGLSSRSYRPLTESGYLFASQIAALSKSQLSSIKNIGVSSIKEIQELMDSIAVEMPSSFIPHDYDTFKKSTPPQNAMSLIDFVKAIPDEKKRQMFQMRLQGLSLEEIAGQVSPPITRERVRQVCAKIVTRKRKTLVEDKYIGIYEKYHFTLEDFSNIFNEEATTYNYLAICSKRGKLPLTDLVNDESFPIEIRLDVERRLNEKHLSDFISVGGELIHKSRLALIHHVIKTYCYEDTLYDDFIMLYNNLIAEIGLEDDPKFSINSRTYENRFQLDTKVLWKQWRRLRYYDVEGYDFANLWHELNLEQYKDVEYSTYKFFKLHPALMQEYDIRDEYELHNLLRKLCHAENRSYMNFSRMPVIEFGNSNREAQLLKVLAEISPARPSDFAVAYEDKYGILARTVTASMLPLLEKYYNKSAGVYDITLAPSVHHLEDNSEWETDSDILDNIKQIISTQFANGFRLHSPIQLARFRAFATSANIDISLSDEELTRYIKASGVVDDGKVYVVSDAAGTQIKNTACEYFNRGAQAIFFDEFFAKNVDWLTTNGIISEAMLIDITRKAFPSLVFRHRAYFGHTKAPVPTIVEEELLRMWGEDVLLSYEQMAERLTYISLERIKHLLATNGDFIWNNRGVFSHVSKIIIYDEERASICAAAEEACNTKGFAAISNLPLCEVANRNHNLFMTAIHTAVYQICLADRFERKNRIITYRGVTLDISSVMRDYCTEVDSCTYDDLIEYEKEITGSVSNYRALEIGYATLIRTGKNSFVSDRHVYFDVEATDTALELLVAGTHLPLRSFAIFAAFPDCGLAWNLFLLESYCRRFSNKFRFESLSTNSQNVGLIVRKECVDNYTEMMASAVASSDIALTEAAITRYLLRAGYIGGSIRSKATEILNKAKVLREGK